MIRIKAALRHHCIIKKSPVYKPYLSYGLTLFAQADLSTDSHSGQKFEWSVTPKNPVQVVNLKFRDHNEQKHSPQNIHQERSERAKRRKDNQQQE